MGRCLNILLSSIFLCFLQEAWGDDMATAPLLRHVLSTPGLTLLPIRAPDQPVHISLMTTVQHIDKVDRENNQVVATLFVSYLWQSGVYWNPEGFNGLTTLVVPGRTLWTPNVMINNAATRLHALNRKHVILMYSGFAVMNMHVKVTLDCDLSADNKCFANFQSADFATRFVHLNGPHGLPFDLSLFHKNWLNTGGRYQARDGNYQKSRMTLVKSRGLEGDIVTYGFSIKDTRPHYSRRPSKMMVWS